MAFVSFSCPHFYLIPILLRITVARNTFVPAEFSLGWWSLPMGCVSVLWCGFMTVVLCLPQETPISASNFNYSPIALGGLLVFSFVYWTFSGRYWFRVAKAALPKVACCRDCLTLWSLTFCALTILERERGSSGIGRIVFSR